jgi:hypothetical protein
LCKSATLLEGRGHDFAEGFLDGVDTHTSGLNDGVLDNLVVLNVEAGNVAKCAGGSTIVRVELRDYREGLDKGLASGFASS